MIPPKPKSRPDRVSLLRYLKLFRKDILSAQPDKLFSAKMAEFRTPFFRSFLINQTDLIEEVLKRNPQNYPKSDRVGAGLKPLLGDSVFLTNDDTWKRQRRIIDPAFEGGNLRAVFPQIQNAAKAAVARLGTQKGLAPIEIEQVTSHAAADVIFRTLFSLRIEDEIAANVFSAFQAYQQTQPILNLAAFIPLPEWVPKFHRRSTKIHAKMIRDLIHEMTSKRQSQIANGNAPDDLATRIMTTKDPLTGNRFPTDEMVDQVAIFFLAGHETSASALAWSLYLLASEPEIQGKVAEEARDVCPSEMAFSELSKLSFTRDVFREALRLYPPVPMMVREAREPTVFRNRSVPKNAQVVISPWHLHRHTRIWDRPDEFDPYRWQEEATKLCAREAFIPFSAGPRVCTGAGFAMVEGVVLLSSLVEQFKFETVSGRIPVPEAHLTIRSKDGIWLRVTPRA